MKGKLLCKKGLIGLVPCWNGENYFLIVEFHLLLLLIQTMCSLFLIHRWSIIKSKLEESLDFLRKSGQPIQIVKL